ncbi:MAG: hypothetical protein PVF55_09185 [Desulfobacterales bacterium]|jgi:hypothetical protein
MPTIANIQLYLKDESTHPTGSLKHRLALELNGHYMDQFAYAEQVTDWRGNNNIADSIFSQMAAEPYPIPTWIVVFAAFQIMAELNDKGHKGSVVSMLCDPWDRYLDTYFNQGWLEAKGFDLKSFWDWYIVFV